MLINEIKLIKYLTLININGTWCPGKIQNQYIYFFVYHWNDSWSDQHVSLSKIHTTKTFFDLFQVLKHPQYLCCNNNTHWLWGARKVWKKANPDEKLLRMKENECGWKKNNISFCTYMTWEHHHRRRRRRRRRNIINYKVNNKFSYMRTF